MPKAQLQHPSHHDGREKTTELPLRTQELSFAFFAKRSTVD